MFESGGFHKWGYPRSFILIGCSLINHAFSGYPHFRKQILYDIVLQLIDNRHLDNLGYTSLYCLGDYLFWTSPKHPEIIHLLDQRPHPGIGSAESAKEFGEQLGLPPEIVFGDEEAESYKNLRFVNSDFSEEPATAGNVPVWWEWQKKLRRGSRLQPVQRGQKFKKHIHWKVQRSWQKEKNWTKHEKKKDNDDHDATASVHADAHADARSGLMNLDVQSSAQLNSVACIV